MRRFGSNTRGDILFTLKLQPYLGSPMISPHDATTNRKSPTFDLQRLEDAPRLFIQTEDTYLGAVISPAVGLSYWHGRSSSVTFSLMSLKPAFRAAMSLDLPEALQTLVEARYKNCQAASKLIFTPSEVTILHTKSGLPVSGILCTAMRK